MLTHISEPILIEHPDYRTSRLYEPHAYTVLIETVNDLLHNNGEEFNKL